MAPHQEYLRDSQGHKAPDQRAYHVYPQLARLSTVTRSGLTSQLIVSLAHLDLLIEARDGSSYRGERAKSSARHWNGRASFG
jgi:hypothetical protein